MTAARRGHPPAARLTRRRDQLLVIGVLLVALWALITSASTPGLAVAMYGLIPVVLAGYWFELRGALLTATVTTLMFLVDKLVAPHPDLAGGAVWLATLNRGLVFVGVGVLVTLLLRRERALALRVRTQEYELA